MRATLLLVLFGCSLTCLACKSEPSPQPMAEQSGGRTNTPPPWAAGGTTGDFGGDCGQCEEPELEALALDDAGPLGFTPQDVLDVVEGVHVGAVRWRDPCSQAEGECERLDSGCPREAFSFAGDETELRVELERTGAPMLETCPARAAAATDAGGYETCIGTFLRIAVRLTLATADGLFGSTIEDELVIEPGSSSLGVGGSLTQDQIDGTLLAELPALEAVEWYVSFGAEGAEADLYLLGAPSGLSRPNLGQLEAAGEGECRVGFPLMPAQ
jgi:hypothetical protein